LAGFGDFVLCGAALSQLHHSIKANALQSGVFCPVSAFISPAITIARAFYLLHPVSISVVNPQALTRNAGAFEEHTPASVFA